MRWAIDHGSFTNFLFMTIGSLGSRRVYRVCCCEYGSSFILPKIDINVVDIFSLFWLRHKRNIETVVMHIDVNSTENNPAEIS